jgi:hypothetical protein
MDEMRIVSKFTRGVISKIAEKLIHRYAGIRNVEVQVNNITVTVDDGITHLHLDVDAELPKGELATVLKSYDLL